MCRLFAISGGETPVSATFWLLDAKDSLRHQSHNNPDGTGIGWFDPDGTAHVDKQPIAGFEDTEFAEEARHLRSSPIIAHVRYSTASAHTMLNTHPFEQNGRLFAHNGAFFSLDEIELAAGDDATLIQGETDSERLFTLITHEIDKADGDVRAGIISAVNWFADNVRLFSINFVLSTATDLWAFRYPVGNELYLLQRHHDDEHGGEVLSHASAHGRIAVRSDHAAEHPVVVIASEPMDDDPRWRAIEVGELVHVDKNLATTIEQVVDHEPRHLLALKDLAEPAAMSQRPLV